MKRILLVFLSIAITLCFCLSLTACKKPVGCNEHKDEDGDGICDTEGCNEAVAPTEPPKSDALNENGDLILFKDGLPTFTFVLGEDATSFMPEVKSLATDIMELTKNNVEPQIESYNSTPREVEILIGSFDNRGEQYKVSKYDYGKNGYTVKQIGTKIIVLGGSDEALANAIKYLKTSVFGIKRTTKPFTDLVMSNPCEIKQSGYSLNEISIGGESIRNYVITYPGSDSHARSAANILRDSLYDRCGIRLEVVTESIAGGMKKISLSSEKNDGVGGGFYVKVDKDNNLLFRCEYGIKFKDLVASYFEDNVFNKTNTCDIPKELNYAPNLRDITYEQFGAVGDGIADDFFAIKAAHDEANMYLLNVHANPNATYRIGDDNQGDTIVIRTNTYWHGCKFIFDDENVAYDSPGRLVPIFSISAQNSITEYTAETLPFTSLKSGASSVDWAPGTRVMVSVEQDDIRHYIRSGKNASQNPDPKKWGQPQHELLLIDANGNIDKNTPVQWTYTNITSIKVFYVDLDYPIEVVGEEFDESGKEIRKTTITTWYNNGPSAYFYYERNICITRSNVRISGIEHKYANYVLESDGGTGSPYGGFVTIDSVNNVVIDNFIYEGPPDYTDKDPNNRPSSYPTPTGAGMGSYEISAGLSNNVTWSNSRQSNFFTSEGIVEFAGNMGTNFCKNLVFDNIFNCSFDAHCGVYNGTIKNSTLEHINFIGDGLIKLENVTVYTDASHSAIKLRTDYGSTWAGDLEIDGLIFKQKSGNSSSIGIVSAEWNNHFYGYTTYLPQNIILRNILTAQYTFTLVGEGNGTNNRVESENYVYNTIGVGAFYQLNNTYVDYGASTVWGQINKNPMVATKSITFYTAYTGKYKELGITTPLKFTPPSGPFFDRTVYTEINS